MLKPLLKFLQRRLYTFLGTNLGVLFACVALVVIVNASLRVIEASLSVRILCPRPTSSIDYEDNIGGASCESVVCAAVPVDAVFTWVNGTEPRFLYELQTARRKWEALHHIAPLSASRQSDLAAAKATPTPLAFAPETYAAEAARKADDSDHASLNRFVDMDELRYTFRSIERHAPWIRRFVLVTNGQVPTWLDLSHPRLTVVPHTVLFPNASALPTFSSAAIESVLHRIPGLADRFIYFNDDTSFGSPVAPTDFELQDGTHKLYLAWDVPPCATGCPASWVGDGFCDATCRNAACDWDGGDCAKTGAPPAWAPSGSYAGWPGVSGSSSYCASGCNDRWIGDGFCDKTCDVEACGFDGGDCNATVWYNAMSGAALPFTRPFCDALAEVSAGVEVPESFSLHASRCNDDDESDVSFSLEGDAAAPFLSILFPRGVEVASVQRSPDSSNSSLVHIRSSIFRRSNNTLFFVLKNINASVDFMVKLGIKVDIASVCGATARRPDTNVFPTLTPSSSDKLGSAGTSRPVSLVVIINISLLQRVSVPLSSPIRTPSRDASPTPRGDSTTPADITAVNHTPSPSLSDASHEAKLHLADTFGSALRFVNRLLSKRFGSIPRKAIAHMPHYLHKDILKEIIEDPYWSHHWKATQNSPFRHPNHMQFAFTYAYFVKQAVRRLSPEDVYKEFDIDGDGVLNPTTEARRIALALWHRGISYDTLYELVELHRKGLVAAIVHACPQLASLKPLRSFTPTATSGTNKSENFTASTPIPTFSTLVLTSRLSTSHSITRTSTPVTTALPPALAPVIPSTPCLDKACAVVPSALAFAQRTVPSFVESVLRHGRNFSFPPSGNATRRSLHQLQGGPPNMEHSSILKLSTSSARILALIALHSADWRNEQHSKQPSVLFSALRRAWHSSVSSPIPSKRPFLSRGPQRSSQRGLRGTAGAQRRLLSSEGRQNAHTEPETLSYSGKIPRGFKAEACDDSPDCQVSTVERHRQRVEDLFGSSDGPTLIPSWDSDRSEVLLTAYYEVKDLLDQVNGLTYTFTPSNTSETTSSTPPETGSSSPTSPEVAHFPRQWAPGTEASMPKQYVDQVITLLELGSATALSVQHPCEGSLAKPDATPTPSERLNTSEKVCTSYERVLSLCSDESERFVDSLRQLLQSVFRRTAPRDQFSRPNGTVFPFSSDVLGISAIGVLLVDRVVPRFKTVEGLESDVTFHMIGMGGGGMNLSLIRNQLDDALHLRNKFICFNDNINHSSHLAATVYSQLKDTLESLYPVPSQFELPPGRFNPFSRLVDNKYSLAPRSNHHHFLIGVAIILICLLISLAVKCCIARQSSISTPSRQVEERSPRAPRLM